MEEQAVVVLDAPMIRADGVGKITFTPQQAVMYRSDQSIADKLGLSTETVRSNWRGIYHRLAAVLPVTDAPPRSGNSSIRGLEKRRIAVDYLRQNLHELRPVERTTRGR